MVEEKLFMMIRPRLLFSANMASSGKYKRDLTLLLNTLKLVILEHSKDQLSIKLTQTQE